MGEDYVTYREYAEHLLEEETKNGKMWSAISNNQAHTENLIKLQWWFMGITSSVLGGLVLWLFKG